MADIDLQLLPLWPLDGEDPCLWPWWTVEVTDSGGQRFLTDVPARDEEHARALLESIGGDLWHARAVQRVDKLVVELCR